MHSRKVFSIERVKRREGLGTEDEGWALEVVALQSHSSFSRVLPSNSLQQPFDGWKGSRFVELLCLSMLSVAHVASSTGKCCNVCTCNQPGRSSATCETRTAFVFYVNVSVRQCRVSFHDRLVRNPGAGSCGHRWMDEQIQSRLDYLMRQVKYK